ncbi:MAG: hypothetical protein LBI42_12445 [Chitinispirillales bacterium]|jgi:hypothetical protein|nr:hypothetical protein [Chitinispirillales bacterium]
MSDSLIAKIESRILELIGNINEGGGYNYNWEKRAAVNMVFSDGTMFPGAGIDLVEEKNIDEAENENVAGPTGANACAYYNVLDYCISIGGKYNGKSPERGQLFKALDDLKKVFGINYTLGDSGASIVMYRGFELVNDENGLLTIKSSWLVRYYQSRTEPGDTAEI